MELRQDLRRVPTRPIVLVMALFAVLALGLTAWYSLVSASTSPAAHPAVGTTSGFPGPDARDRNQQLQQAHEKDPEATHGH